MPFGSNAANRDEMATMIAEDELEFKNEDNIDEVTQDFLRGVLAKDPSDRLTVEEIKAHEYFKEMCAHCPTPPIVFMHVDPLSAATGG
jgi:serine/threonine protein kinase